MKRNGARLKIQSDDLGRNTRVWFNGEEISHCLQGVTVDFGCDDVNHAELRILVDRLEVDADTLAMLKAHVESNAETA